MIASAIARTAAPPSSRGMPSFTIMSQIAPVPMPRMTRPPDSADSEVSVRASTGAGRLGRLVTVTMPVMRSVWPSRNPVSAYASSLLPKYGWSATVNRSRPSRSAWVASRTRPAASAASAPFHWPREAPNRT